jgi:hypothetical protein
LLSCTHPGPFIRLFCALVSVIAIDIFLSDGNLNNRTNPIAPINQLHNSVLIFPQLKYD